MSYIELKFLFFLSLSANFYDTVFRQKSILKRT